MREKALRGDVLISVTPHSVLRASQTLAQAGPYRSQSCFRREHVITLTQLQDKAAVTTTERGLNKNTYNKQHRSTSVTAGQVKADVQEPRST